MKKLLFIFIMGMFLINFSFAQSINTNKFAVGSDIAPIFANQYKLISYMNLTCDNQIGCNVYIPAWNLSLIFIPTNYSRDEIIKGVKNEIRKISKDLSDGLNINSKVIFKQDLQSGNESLNVHVIETDEIYTKSRVPDATGKYFNLFNSSIYSKFTHFAYQIVNGQPRLNQESRDVGQEGYIACDRKCTQQYLNQDKFKDYTVCKSTC